MSAAPREPHPLRLTLHRVHVEVTDDQLAEQIRSDGRTRLGRGDHVSLAELLGAIPGLPDRPLAFDAAIDIALRSLSGSTHPTPEAVESLVLAHPEHEEAIRTSAVLSAALWRTHEGLGLGTAGPHHELPMEFGPAGADGHARYLLEARIGQGSSGEVFRAVDRCLSGEHHPARVAIKVLRAGRADALSRARFIEEASKARLLDHPNAVRVFDRGETPSGELYIVYELVEGGDLQSWVSERADQLTTEIAVRLVERVAEAIKGAHAAGLVHLDLKPANILVSKDGAPKVADFGLSVHGSALRADAIGSGDSRVGTLAFMAPEQFLDESGAASPQADIYALGGVLLWLVTGELPNGATVEAIREAHESRRSPAARVRAAWGRARSDRDLIAICCRALAPSKAERYASAGEFAADLRAWLDIRPIAWTRPSPVRIAVCFARRRPGVALLLVALTTALIGALVASERARVHAAASHAMELEARAAQERLAADGAWRKWAADNLAKRLESFKKSSRSGLAGEVLLSLWVLETVHGPTLLNNMDSIAQIRESRIETIREMLTRSEESTGPASHSTLELRALLGFLLAKHGEFAEAESQVAECQSGWCDRLAPDDPWLADLEAIRLAAAAGRMVGSLGGKAPQGEDRAAVIRVERQLLEHFRRLASRTDGAQIRQLILERLREIYGPTCLANGEWSRWVKESIAYVGLESPDDANR